MKSTFVFLLLLCASTTSLLSACGTTLTKAESDIELLDHSDPPKACKELGEVWSYQGGVCSWLAGKEAPCRREGLKKAAADKGGNTVKVLRRETTGVFEGEYVGVAYRCP